jgi:hypothetical protein
MTGVVAVLTAQLVELDYRGSIGYLLCKSVVIGL